jgi:hypothetical protein
VILGGGHHTISVGVDLDPMPASTAAE